MRQVWTILLTVFIATPALAAQWTVDYAKSRLDFSVPWQEQSFDGQFKSWKAAITFDPADLGHANAQVSVDLSSVSSGEADTDAGVKGPQGFDTARFAVAKFNATAFRIAGAGRYIAQGTLDLHGVTKPVAVSFALQIKGHSAHMTGTADIVRTDFGVGMGQFAQDTPVGRKVTVKIDLTATVQP